MLTETQSSSVALVVVAQSQYDNWESLPEVPQAVKELATALSAGGYELKLPKLIDGGTRAEVIDPLDQLLSSMPDHSRLVFYWTGHGTGDVVHYLVMKDSPQPVTAAKALPTRDLGDLIAASKVEKVLLILDTCFAGAGAQGIAQDVYDILNSRTALPGQVRFAGVLPSVSALQRAQAGVFCRALHKVLAEPSVPGRPWGDNDEFIRVSELEEFLGDLLQTELGNSWQPFAPFAIGRGDRFLPNPRYRGPQAAVDVETARLVVPSALELASRGIELGVPGTYFTGRTRLLGELNDWLTKGSGLLALTGSPGFGKSAVLGRLVTLSKAQSLQAGETVPPPTLPSDLVSPGGLVDAAVHAKGFTVAQCARDIAGQLAIELPDDVSFDLAGFLGRIRALKRPIVVVVDALDEAAEPIEIATLLRRMATECRARVLVGTRRSPDGRPISEAAHRHGRLTAMFGDQARILDLDDEQDTSVDIAAYVTARLKDDPRSLHRGEGDSITLAANAIADKADGAFLYARVVSRTLQEAATLDTKNLPAGPLEAFVHDLLTRFDGKGPLVDQLLSALAWGEGGGLSRWAWPRVAAALYPELEAPADADVAWVLDHAGFHILEAGEAGQTVYRLAHQSFADYYRQRVRDEVEAQRAIAEALRQA